MKYIKEIKDFGKMGTDFYTIEVWVDYKNGKSSIFFDCLKLKNNVYVQLKKYKEKVAVMWKWDKDNNTVNLGRVKDIRIVVNGVDIMDIDNWEVELDAKKYNL